jgi:hypothetical protein
MRSNQQIFLYGIGSSNVPPVFTSPLVRTARAETLTAEYRPSARRFERYRVCLPALIAGDLEPLAFAATTGAAKISTTRISARLATLRLAQIALGVILLLPLRERERFAALAARNINIWHDTVFSLRKRGLAMASLSFFSAHAG